MRVRARAVSTRILDSNLMSTCVIVWRKQGFLITMIGNAKAVPMIEYLWAYHTQFEYDVFSV